MGSTRYLYPAPSAIMDRSLTEVPFGVYIPSSHSLMVCCLVPSSWASSCWVIARCFLSSHTVPEFQMGFFPFSAITGALYTEACK